MTLFLTHCIVVTDVHSVVMVMHDNVMHHNTLFIDYYSYYYNVSVETHINTLPTDLTASNMHCHCNVVTPRNCSHHVILNCCVLVVICSFPQASVIHLVP